MLKQLTQVFPSRQILILTGLLMFALLCGGCVITYGGIEIQSPSDDDETVIDQRFSDCRLVFLSKGADNNSLWTITDDTDNQLFISQYNLKGDMLQDFQLKTFTSSWLWPKNRCFIAEKEIFFFHNDLPDGIELHSYDLKTHADKMLAFFDQSNSIKLYSVNLNYIVAVVTREKANRLTVYTIDINDGKMLSQIDFDDRHTHRLLGIYGDDMKALISSYHSCDNYPLSVFDLRTGKELMVAGSTKIGTNYAMWVDNGHKIIYNDLNKLYLVDCDTVPPARELLFAAEPKYFISSVVSFSENTILFRYWKEDYSYNSFVIYDFVARKELKRFPASGYISNLTAIGKYIVFEN